MTARGCLCGDMWAEHGWLWQDDRGGAAPGCRCVRYQPRPRARFGLRWLRRRVRGAA